METKNFEIYYNNINRFLKLALTSYGASCCASLLGHPLICFPLWLSGNVFNYIASDNRKKCVNCTEYEILRKSYDFVLQHIIELSKTINFTSVEEVYILFEFLFKNNYLSFNRLELNDTIATLPAEKTIQAELSLNNHGVCRNKSYALADIYQGLGIDAGVMPGIHIETLLKLDPTKDPELKKALEEDPYAKILINIINDVLNSAFPEMKDIDKYIKKQVRKNKCGNHAITVINHNERSYYFDSSLHNIYFEDQEDPNKLTNYNGSLFILKPKANKDYSKKLSGFQDRKYKSADIREVMPNITDAVTRINDYNETIDNFHQDINPALEEAENAFQSLRKSIKK